MGGKFQFKQNFIQCPNVTTTITSTTNDIEQDISVSIDTSTNELQFSTTQDTLLIDESKTTATEGILQLFGF